MKDEYSLPDQIKQEIIDPSLDLTIDYAELGLDSFIDEEYLKDVPYFGTIVKFFKLGSSLKNATTIRKIFAFFKALHSGNIEEVKKVNFKIKLETDEAFSKKVIECILIMNERFLEIEKSKVLGHLLRANINNEIDWSTFNSLCSILDRMYPESFKYMHDNPEKLANASGDDPENESLLFACGIGHRYGTHFRITKKGLMLYKHGIKPLFEISE